MSLPASEVIPTLILVYVILRTPHAQRFKEVILPYLDKRRPTPIPLLAVSCLLSLYLFAVPDSEARFGRVRLCHNATPRGHIGVEEKANSDFHAIDYDALDPALQCHPDIYPYGGQHTSKSCLLVLLPITSSHLT